VLSFAQDMQIAPQEKALPDTSSDLNLGGDDIDSCIQAYLSTLLGGPQDEKIAHRLKDAAEEAKIQLSSSSQADVNLASHSRRKSTSLSHYSSHFGGSDPPTA